MSKKIIITSLLLLLSKIAFLQSLNYFEEIETNHSYKIQKIEYSPNNNYVASISFNEVIVWKLPEMKFYSKITTEKEITDCNFSPNEKMLFISHLPKLKDAVYHEKGEVHLWNIAKSTKTDLVFDNKQVLSFMPDSLVHLVLSKNIYSTYNGSTFVQNSFIQLFKGDLNNVFAYKIFKEKISEIALCKKSNTLAVGFVNGFIRIFNLETLKQTDSIQFTKNPIQEIVFSKDGDYMSYFVNRNFNDEFKLRFKKQKKDF